MKFKNILVFLTVAVSSPASADFVGRVGFSNGSMDSVWSGGVSTGIPKKPRNGDNLSLTAPLVSSNKNL